MWSQFDYRTVADIQERRLQEAAHERLVRAFIRASAPQRPPRSTRLVIHRLGIVIEVLGRKMQSLPTVEEGFSRHELSR